MPLFPFGRMMICSCFGRSLREDEELAFRASLKGAREEGGKAPAGPLPKGFSASEMPLAGWRRGSPPS